MKNKKLISVPIRDVFQNAFMEIDSVKKVITHYITSGEPNRYSQVVNISGFNESDYRKNPIVLFNHGDADMLGTLEADDILDFLIGRNEWIVQDGNYLKAKTEFNNSELACELFDLYANKFMNCWSKNFYPISEPRYQDGNVFYDQWGIYEYSACMIPVDANATTIDVSFENAIKSVKNGFLKNALSNIYLKNKIESDPETEKLLIKLNSFESEFNTFKTELNSLKESIVIERNTEIKKAIEQYNSIIHPKLLEIADGLNLLVQKQPELINTCVVGAIRKAQGKID